MGRVKRIWYLSPMRAAKVQASLRIRAVSPEPPLLAHTSSESRGTFRQKARSLAPLNGWACAVKICHDEMLEDTNSLDAVHMINIITLSRVLIWTPCLCLDKYLCIMMQQNQPRAQGPHDEKSNQNGTETVNIHFLYLTFVKQKEVNETNKFQNCIQSRYLIRKLYTKSYTSLMKGFKKLST